MSKFVQVVFNAAFTAAFATGFTQVRPNPYGKDRDPRFVFRKNTKSAESLYGYGTSFVIEDGQAVIRTPLAQWLARMEKEPTVGTFFLKDTTGNQYQIAAAVPAVKEGKRQLVSSEYQVTISVEDDEPVSEPVVEVVAEEPAAIVEPEVVEEPVAEEPVAPELVAVEETPVKSTKKRNRR